MMACRIFLFKIQLSALLIAGVSVHPPLHKDTDSLLQACCLSGAKIVQSSNSGEWNGSTLPLSLTPLSSLQLGGIIPFLCVFVMGGKKARITTGEELADNYMGWRGAKKKQADYTSQHKEYERGPNQTELGSTHLVVLHLCVCAAQLQGWNTCGRKIFNSGQDGGGQGKPM